MKSSEWSVNLVVSVLVYVKNTISMLIWKAGKSFLLEN